MAKRAYKKVAGLLAVLMLLALVCGVAVACSQGDYKVTFYDGETVIAEKWVNDGERVQEFTPEDEGYTKEGYIFGGWYATADFTFDWSFDTAITQDTNVYSMWSSSAEDTRQWLIAGSSSVGGPLAAIGWNGGPVEGENGNILTKTAGKNEFTITSTCMSAISGSSAFKMPMASGIQTIPAAAVRAAANIWPKTSI